MKEGYKKTEIGVIPEDWGIADINSISTFCSNGFVGTASPYYSENGIPYLMSNNVRENKIDKNKLTYVNEAFVIKHPRSKIYKGDMLTVQSGHIGTSCIVSSEFDNCNCHALIITRFIKEKISPSFCSYYLNSVKGKNRLSNIFVGTTIKHINVKDFVGFKIPIPPLKEQEKIAEILSSVDGQIDDTEMLIEKCRVLKKGLMQRLLSKGIGHSEFKISEVGEIPVGWEVKKFKDITDILRCGVASTPQYVDEGIMFLSAQNVQETGLSLHKYNCITREYHEKLTKNDKPQRGDILYSRVGANYGMATVVDIDEEFSVYVSLTLIRMKKEYYSEFYKYLLNSSFCKKQADIGVFQGAGVPNLNVKIVEEFKMIVPPFKEQKKIAEILSSVDDEIKEYENKKQSLEELKKGLMQQLLTGKIRTIF